MNLISAMQSQYSTAKQLLRGVWLCLAVLFVAGILNLLPTMKPYANIIAIAVFVMQLLIFGLRYVAGIFIGEAEKVRRMAMLFDGLGATPTPAQIAQLHVQVAKLKNGEPKYIGNYYDSNQPAGPRRLIEITSECAFFTCNNARFFARFIFSGLIFATLLTVVGLLIAIFSVVTIDEAQTAARIFIVAMTFWAVGDLANTWLAFNGVATTCERICQSGEQVLRADPNAVSDSNMAIALFADYNSAIAKSPPIPSWVYAHRLKLLNDAWKQRVVPPSSGIMSSE